MRKVKLTSEWLANWKTPKRREEVADGLCRGLVVRAGPTGAKTFYYWTDAPGAEADKKKRRRVKLGRWAIDAGGGALSLDEARKAFLALQATKRAEVDGTGEKTVAQIVEAYRRDVLSHRERAAEAWNVIRVHIVEAQPDPKRPAFGLWPARAVRAADVADVVRYAMAPRVVEGRSRTGQATSRRLGGRGIARVVLRELKAIFGHAVETGALEMTPAGVTRARSFGLRAGKRTRYLDAKEVEAFFAALDLSALLDGTAKRQRLSATVRLALGFQLYVPLRSHSLIGARWEEFDLDVKRWTVPVSRLKLHKDERAEARPFEVPLPATAVEILRRLRALSPESPWVLASPLDPTKHVESKALIRALERLQSTGRLAFGSKIVVHDLRRSWRSLALDLGVPIEVAERSMGHATALRAAGASGAADVYGRGQMVERRAEAGELVAAALDRIRLGTAAKVTPLAQAVRS